MKKILALALLITTIVACKKEESSVYKVKYSVTGNLVTEAKFNYKNSIHSFKEGFSGTRDTIVYMNKGETLGLSAKASSSSLKGIIYVNDQPVSEQIDSDLDKDGKTEIKLDYTIK